MLVASSGSGPDRRLDTYTILVSNGIELKGLYNMYASKTRLGVSPMPPA